MYIVPRRALKLSVVSCEGLPPITSNRLWQDERVRNEHDRLKRSCADSEQQFRASTNCGGNGSQLAFITTDPSAMGSPHGPCALYMEFAKAWEKLQSFESAYGTSASSGKTIAPNCYARVTLERNSAAPALAVTEVKRANYCPFWNCSSEDINIDLMLLCGEMESATYLYCQRLKIAVYHDFGFGQDASCTSWKADTLRDGMLIGEAFIALGDVLAEPCLKRHVLKLYSGDHGLMCNSKVHVETTVSCKNAKVPKMMPCQSAFPMMLPVEIEKECGKGCSGADVALSVCDSISVPSAVQLAVVGSSSGSGKHKCKGKSKCKTKSSHRC